MDKPVIFLAFANDLGDEKQYLRNLPKELNQLRAIWERMEEDGLCELLIRSNVTAEELFQIFEKPKYRGRIALFHFGGHANSFELLLNDFAQEDQKQAAFAAGFIPFLAGQAGLQLVFLNGCYTIKMAEELTQSGLPAVIGTVQAVNDEIASDLSSCFYQALSLGLNLGHAWESATNLIKTKLGIENFVNYYSKSPKRGAVGAGRYPKRFPWEIFFKKGAEEDVKSWNLPEAAHNPLFGLPPIPDKYRLPEEPYQFLKRYEKEDAAIFFGRGRDLRKLYSSVISEDGPPVILLFGQSGVGKSSLLNAGLFPRLENDYSISIIRRKSEVGLFACLMEALNLEQAETRGFEADRKLQAAKKKKDIEQLEQTLQSLTGEAQQDVMQVLQKNKEEYQQLLSTSAPPDLREAWSDLEARIPQKSHLIILDQVEEVFTRPNERLPNELEVFLEEVSMIFRDPHLAPKGKLVLSYRKEYASDLEKALRKKHIDREEIFLDKLDKEGIMEIVEGLASTERLRRRYKLEIEPGLPLMIANDLLADKDSPVAPILQIILSRFWYQEHSGIEPVYDFTIDEYLQLKEEGVYLGDFFDQQMERIREWEEREKQQVESSGLALDVLNYHTTPLATAQSHSLEELRQLYQHNEEVLEDLIRRFKEEYLLTDLEPKQTSLAHDTLAPVVHQRIKSSNHPGQRALRILENKVIDYERDAATIIEEEDLALVEKGASGMRIWMPKEKELIEKSRQYRAEREVERQRNKRFRQFAVGLITFLAVLATFFWIWNDRQKKIAKANNLYNEGRLLLSEDPYHGIEKMYRAYLNIPKDTDKLKGAYLAYEENLLYTDLMQDSAGLNQVAFSKDGKYFATTAPAVGKEQVVHLYTIQGRKLRTYKGPDNKINSLIFQGSDYLLASSEDKHLYRWSLRASSDPQILEDKPEENPTPARTMTISPDGRWLVTGHAQPGYLQWIDLQGDFSQAERIDIPASPTHINAVVFAGTSNTLFIGLDNGRIFSYSQAEKEFFPIFENQGSVKTLAATPDGKLLGAGYSDRQIFIWDLQNETPQLLDELKEHSGEVLQLAFSPNGQFFLSGSADGTARIWETASRTLLSFSLKHQNRVHSLAFSTGTDTLFTGSEDGIVRGWAFPNPLPAFTFPTGRRINQVVFSPQGDRLLAASANGHVYIWKAPFDVKELQDLNLQIGRILSLAIGPQGQYGVVGTRLGSVAILEIESGQVIRTEQLHSKKVNDLCFSSDMDGKLLLSGSDDQKAILWRWQEANLDTLVFGGHNGELSAVAFSPDNREIITGGLDSLLIWQDVASGKILRKEKQAGDILQISYISESGDPLIVLSTNSIVKWGKNANTFSMPAKGTSVAFNTNNFFFCSLDSYGNQVKVCTPEGYAYQNFWAADRSDRLMTIAVQPNGSWVAAGSRSGNVHLWQVSRNSLESLW